jgi:hypothetical protein
MATTVAAGDQKKFVVTDKVFREIDGVVGEIKRQLNQKSDSPLDPVLVKLALQRIVDQQFIQPFMLLTGNYEGSVPEKPEPDFRELIKRCKFHEVTEVIEHGMISQGRTPRYGEAVTFRIVETIEEGLTGLELKALLKFHGCPPASFYELLVFRYRFQTLGTTYGENPTVIGLGSILRAQYHYAPAVTFGPESALKTVKADEPLHAGSLFLVRTV